MKRFLSILLMLCLACCLLPMPVHAVSKTYDLDELGMDIDFSEDLVVFTRDIKSNDPSLGEYGLTKDSLTTLMRERNIYLYAWDKDINYEIIIETHYTITRFYVRLTAVISMVLRTVKGG